jgi:choline dehydrogenase-like flavoprotein
MVQRLKPVDVVTIGVELTGSLAALELAKEGLTIVGLERGAARFTVPDFQSPAIHDELRFSIRKGMMQDNTKVAVTFRNNWNETALPIRRWESFLPGQGLGGSFVHWNGQSFRAQVADFIYKTHHEQPPSTIEPYKHCGSMTAGRQCTMKSPSRTGGRPGRKPSDGSLNWGFRQRTRALTKVKT